MTSPERMLAKATLLYMKERGMRILRKRGGRLLESAKRVAESAAFEAGRLKARFDIGVEEYKRGRAEETDPRE